MVYVPLINEMAPGRALSDGVQLVNMVESVIIPSMKRISTIQLLHRHLIKHVMLLMFKLETTFMAT